MLLKSDFYFIIYIPDNEGKSTVDWKPILGIVMALIAFTVMIWALIKRSSKRRKLAQQKLENSISEFVELLRRAEDGDLECIEALANRYDDRYDDTQWWPAGYDDFNRSLSSRANDVLGKRKLRQDIDVAAAALQPHFAKLKQAEEAEAEFKAIQALTEALRSHASGGRYDSVGTGVIWRLMQLDLQGFTTLVNEIVQNWFDELTHNTRLPHDDADLFSQIFELVRMVENSGSSHSPFYPLRLNKLKRDKISWNELVIVHMPGTARPDDLTYEWERPFGITRNQAHWYGSHALASKDVTMIGMARILLVELDWFESLAKDLAAKEHELRGSGK